MEIDFWKYQGAGNDFVMIDNRMEFFPKADQGLIERLCNRRFGIGADGLILLENLEDGDFKMIYFNADGKESSMCGNGGRCIVAFAKQLGLIDVHAKFLAIDGMHQAELLADGRVALGMMDVSEIETVSENEFVLNTGSPHYVVVEKTIPNDFVERAKAIRNNQRFIEEGINVNFIQVSKDEVVIRTYERGVEAETLACGTGAVAAAAIAAKYTGGSEFKLQTKGGGLEVQFSPRLTEVVLTGEATLVFRGFFEHL